MSWRLEEEIANAGAPPLADQVPPLEEGMYNNQAPMNPPPLVDENIRDALFQMSQDITTQAQAATAQVESITTKANR